MKRTIWLAGLAFCAMPASAQDEDLPPIPASLIDAAGAVCVGVSRTGSVSGAYILASTGNAQADQDLIGWARQLRWPAAEPGEKPGDKWLPVPFAYGDKDVPDIRAECAAPPHRH